MNYSATDITSVTVAAGTSAIAANKSVTCSSKTGSTICVVSGMNASILSNGVLATATFKLASSITATSEQIQVTNVVASTAGGMAISASGAGSTITVGTPTSWTISGTTSSTGSGATVTLSGAASATVTADASGNYTFTNLANGTYTITPTKSSYTFSPASQNATINGANVTGINFTAQCSSTTPCTQTWGISGTITSSTAGSGATLTLSGAASKTAAADASGKYTFSGLANGSYTVTPSKSGYTFSPPSKSVTLNGTDLVVDFTALTCNKAGKNCKPAAMTSDVCSPGSLTTLSGDSFTSQNAQQAASFPLPTQLAGVRVTVNGSPAPLLFVSDKQISFQCPVAAPESMLELNVEAESGGSTFLGQSTMRAVMPALFNADNTSQGVVLIGATNDLAMPKTNSAPTRPAQKGEFVTIYATGLGEVVDEVPAGTPAPVDRLVRLKNKVSVVVGGVEVESAFAGLAPGTVGLFQVNAQLPQNVPAGPAVPLFVRVTLADGTAFASNTVSMAID